MAANQVLKSSTPTVVDTQHQNVHIQQQGSASTSEATSDNISLGNGKGVGAAISSRMAGKSVAKTFAGKSTTHPSGDTSSFHTLRFKISLLNGFFTNVLKDELLFDLNNFLYQLPSTSFIPSFNGHGLRFGKIWFSPENEESSDWLKQKLNEINEKAVDGCKFRIEQFGLHQNKVCLNVPLIPNEHLSDADVLKSLHFQNPSLGFANWKILRTKSISTNNRLVICSIDDCSYNLLKKLNYKINYGFQKVLCKPYMQTKPAKPRS